MTKIKILLLLFALSVVGVEDKKKGKLIVPDKLKSTISKYYDRLVGIPDGRNDEVSVKGFVTKIIFEKGSMKGLFFEDDNNNELYFPESSIKWLSYKSKKPVIDKLIEISKAGISIILILFLKY